jgi:uncharacterized protein
VRDRADRGAVGVGLLGGAVGALLGGGTGVVTVPALDRLTTLRRVVIHGTANLVNVAVAVVGGTVYELHGGHLDPAVAVGLMVGGVAGAFLGARIAARAGDQALRVAFAAVLAVAGTDLCLGAAGVGPSGGSPLLPGAVRGDAAAVAALTVVIGIAVGAFVGLALSGTALDWVFGLFVLFMAVREARKIRLTRQADGRGTA